MFKKFATLVVMMVVSLKCSAWTECALEVSSVWTNLYSADTSVWIIFKGGAGPIYKFENQMTEGQMNRMYSTALTALTAKKKLRVRYPDENMKCPPLSSPRNDVIGFYILE